LDLGFWGSEVMVLVYDSGLRISGLECRTYEGLGFRKLKFGWSIKGLYGVG
jgi:hypothetical protein